MTGIEAQSLLDRLLKIKRSLLDNEDRYAFFEMGSICNELSNIIAIDEVSFNPTVKKNKDKEESDLIDKYCDLRELYEKLLAVYERLREEDE